MSLLILSSANVRDVVSSFSTTFLQDLMGRVFLAISQAGATSEGAAHIQIPHRIAVDMKSHTTLFMPARISSSNSSLEGTSIKVVSVPRKQDDIRGLPATTLVLNEETGAVEAVVNARELTALRNAAGSLLSTTLIGIREPKHIVLFGAGKQVETHINVFLGHFPGVKSCTIVNRSLNERALDLYKSATATFQRVVFHLFSEHERESIQEAVQKASIIICATPSTSPLFPSAWVTSGTHVILIGSYNPFMQEVDETLVRRAIPTISPNLHNHRIDQILTVDSRDACLKEAGELIKARVDQASMLEIGELIMQSGRSLAEVLSQRPPVVSADFNGPNTSTGPITMFKSVGVGLQDVVMAKEVVQYAKDILHTGTMVEHYDTVY